MKLFGKSKSKSKSNVSLRSSHGRDPYIRCEPIEDIFASYLPRLYHELQELQGFRELQELQELQGFRELHRFQELHRMFNSHKKLPKSLSFFVIFIKN